MLTMDKEAKYLMDKFKLEGLTQREYERLDKLFKKNKEQFPTCKNLTDLINLEI